MVLMIMALAALSVAAAQEMTATELVVVVPLVELEAGSMHVR